MSDSSKLVQRTLRFFFFLAVLSAGISLYRGGVRLVQLPSPALELDRLPRALGLSFLRMSLAYVAALAFAFSVGLAAARSRTGEKFLLPALDVLQSVPIIGFFPAAISLFVGLTQGNRIGIELAAVFLIFTSQAWNLAFAVYEAVKTIPRECFEAVSSFGVNGSHRFWKLYAPASAPRLVYNSILSWSNGWYFLVASEIIAVGHVRYHLPGIGSFLAVAAEQDRIDLVLWGLSALTLLILLMDFLIWRPASVWTERFRYDFSSSIQNPRLPPYKRLSWISERWNPFDLALKRIGRKLAAPVVFVLKRILLPIFWDLPFTLVHDTLRPLARRMSTPAIDRWNQLISRSRRLDLLILWMIGAIVGIWTGQLIFRYLSPPWPSLVFEIPLALLASTGRIMIALGISLAWVLPVVWFTWDRPRVRQALATVAQVGASLPATALFPLIILVIVRRLGGGMELSSILLLITGMQWYILFNSLGGVAGIPSELADVTRSLGLNRYALWRRLVLPAIRPSLLTGILTAWGGGWNALVVSEYLVHQDQVLTVNGIGALLNRAVYQSGDSQSILLCLASLVIWVVMINAWVWRPLYQSSAERYNLGA